MDANSSVVPLILHTHLPLVVDLDGTLTPADTLAESLVTLVKQSPLNLLRLPFWLMRGRASFKEAIAVRVGSVAEHLPYREPLLEYLRTERANGRQIVLATAAHHSIAETVAAHLGLFDIVLATRAGQNLKGRAKLAAIHAQVGKKFVYAGDSSADLPIWKSAEAAILVNVSTRVAQSVRQEVRIEQEIEGEKCGLSDWLQALRVHQWLKNLLLFVPLLTAFSFTDITKLASISLAFLAFSFAASASYILNDLWDLANDRAHPRKRNRPFASAKIPILHGLAAAACALFFAVFLALIVSTGFTLMLLLYLVLTSIYSWILKGHVLMDVVMLSLLYTLRILAGSVAIEVATSEWLLAFSVFMFLSLATVKRCAELVSLGEDGATTIPGRDYRVSDLVVLWPLGVGAALSAAVVFGLFISAADTRERYETPDLLWLVAIGMIYWLGRLWVKTSRGEMHDDPVLYAIKDRGSRFTVLGMAAVILVAHFITLDWLL